MTASAACSVRTLPRLPRLPAGGAVRVLLTVLLLLATGCDSADYDDDGFSIDEGDCNDRDFLAYPGAEELCDGIDNDCDEQIDEGLDTADRDSDGVPGCQRRTCAGVPEDPDYFAEKDEAYTPCPADCDDADPAAVPGAAEVCDGRDNDCDALKDEDEGDGAADITAWYEDRDGDGYGGGTDPVMACGAPAGHASTNDDCDDGDVPSISLEVS